MAVFSALFRSPWRQDQRPIEGILHGLYLQWHVVTFLSDAGATLAEVGRLEERRQAELGRIQETVYTLRSSEALTPSGRLVLEQAIRDQGRPA
jgi:HEXXH motif-containing protein